MPPSPWIHSKTTPAVRGPMASSSAAASFGGTNFTPASSGSKSLRYFAWPVTEIAPMVRPWKELSSETISYFSGLILPPWERTILIAASMASVPELQKKLRSSPLISASRFASGPWYS